MSGALCLGASTVTFAIMLSETVLPSRVIVSSLGLVAMVATVGVTVVLGNLVEGKGRVILAVSSVLLYVFVAGLCLNFLSQASTSSGVFVRETLRLSIALAVAGPWCWLRSPSRRTVWLVIGAAPAFLACLILVMQGESASDMADRSAYSVVLQYGAVLSLLNQLPVIVDQLVAAGLSAG